MIITETSIKDCLLIQPNVFKDERGYFLESFNNRKFQQLTGIKSAFVQDNESMSNYGVIRGLHAQIGASAQAKLVRVVKGSVLDVVVDTRFDSPTFGTVLTVDINANNKHQLYIPKGCLHGFSVLENETIFSYKCDNYYDPANEIGVNPLDDILSIDWKVDTKQAQISKKDKAGLSFSDYVARFKFKAVAEEVEI